MKEKNYDFNLILSEKELKDNQDRIKEQNAIVKTKLKLKVWIKAFLLLLIGALIGITIYQLFTFKTVKVTSAGNYTCYGKFIEICKGSNAAADFLGV